MTQRHSPREPFMALPAGTHALERPAPERKGFRILNDWRWRDALEGSAGPGLRASRSALLGSLGLFPARGFSLAGECADCATPDAALWYFRDEIIAVPADASLTAAAASDDALPPPPLIWIGAPEVIEHARLIDDGKALEAAGMTVPLAVPPRIPTNAAYVDASTVRFFERRTLRARSATHVEKERTTFVARALWPEDTRIDVEALRLEPLRETELLSSLIEEQAEATTRAYPARLLYERGAEGSRRWAGKPVVAFVLSGAQGDDDGSLAGHLAIATGVFGPRGEWSDWLINNFYPLEEANAKGIVPASLPMDGYLFDFNSGQLYYRPAYMLVAVLGRQRAAAAIQAVLQDNMTRFYCGDIEFDRSSYNSTAMSIDPLRSLGWRIPRMGPTSRILGVLAAPIAAVVARRLSTARDIFKALSSETTRLLPRVAFEVAGHDLLYLAAAEDEAALAEMTPFERTLADDVEAIFFVRLPQVPSARRFGRFPVRSLVTYGAQLLADPTPFERAPEAGERELPEALEESCAGG